VQITALDLFQPLSMAQHFNPLPTPPLTARPALLLLAWGAGNFGQFGMGPDVLDSLNRPRRNKRVEAQIVKGTFGESGAGITAIAAGGLHTLFIDENEIVHLITCCYIAFYVIDYCPRCGLVVRLITPPLVESLRTFQTLITRVHFSTLTSSRAGPDQFKL
jgi:hypothetical protein